MFAKRFISCEAFFCFQTVSNHIFPILANQQRLVIDLELIKSLASQIENLPEIQNIEEIQTEISVAEEILEEVAAE